VQLLSTLQDRSHAAACGGEPSHAPIPVCDTFGRRYGRKEAAEKKRIEKEAARQLRKLQVRGLLRALCAPDSVGTPMSRSLTVLASHRVVGLVRVVHLLATGGGGEQAAR